MPRCRKCDGVLFCGENIYRYNYNRRNFICTNCVNKRKREYYHQNIERERKRQKKWRERYKRKVFIHYSGDPPKCACCGESHIEFLSIDHIKGGGNRARKKDNTQKLIYLWLYKKNYPDGYQVLCRNCNWAKGIYGVCPHRQNGTFNKENTK